MRSPPSEYSAIIGDSKLLCVLGRTGEISRLFWPHVDYGQHVEVFKIGFQFQGQREVLWLGDRGWTHAQSYQQGTNTVITLSRHKRRRISASSAAFALPGSDSIVLQYAIHNGTRKAARVGLGVYTTIKVNESPFYNSALFDERSGCLVFYFRDVAIAIRASGILSGYQCGVAGEESSALRRNQWNLTGSSIQHKDPDGAVLWDLGQLKLGKPVPITIYVSAGETVREAIQRSEAVGRLDASQVPRDPGLHPMLASIRSAWRSWLSTGEAQASDDEPNSPEARYRASLRPQIHNRQVANRPVLPELARRLGKKGQELYQRSLLTLKLLSDRETGAIIAAPEFDREREACGGYGYVWGRDAAFNAYALGMAGMVEEAEAFFEFARRVQEPDGVWLHRHYASGELAPSWGLVQIDETGAIIWAAYEHYRMTGSRDFLNAMWDSIARGADYLAGSIDEETGLPLPSFELWEEQLCESVYSAAAVVGGLRAAAACAVEVGKRTEGRRWRQLADQMRDSITRVLWDPKAKSFLKSLKKSISESEFSRPAPAGVSDSYIELAEGQLYPEFIQVQDHTVDSSLLGLSFPFRVLNTDDTMMRQAVAAVARRLWSPKVGGIMRYEGDHYVGGNPWILTTLWLAIYYLEAGTTPRALRLIKWAVDHATELGLLTEQVDKKTGKPIWAVPLGWSHAMYVIAALKLAAK